MINNQTAALLLVEDLGMQYPTATSKKTTRFGMYKCYCGNVFKASTDSVKREYTKSCGCRKNTTHKLSNHPLYSVWFNMLARTSNPEYDLFKYYGDRGISVCNRWLTLENFIADMSEGFSPGLTLDRRDNDGNYEPSNCRWASKTTQTRNTRLIHSHNKSGYRGVSWNKAREKWYAFITLNNKAKYLGSFDTAIEAAAAYDTYVIINKLEHTINGVTT